jgi:hypothetical protein
MITILIILILYLIYFSYEKKYKYDEDENEQNLKNQGFCVFNTNQNLDLLDPIEKRQQITSLVLSKLPYGYTFLDYYYYIKGCSLSTYHRDVTSGQTYLKTKYPTYTLILYEYDGDFLSLCPNSHKQYPFIYSTPINISGKKNTMVLFNADILHSGIINKIGKNRKVLQMKIVHHDDLHLFDELNKIKVEKTTDCNNNILIEHSLRFMSLHFAWFINGLIHPLLQKKYTDDNLLSYIQDKVPISFYNNL